MIRESKGIPLFFVLVPSLVVTGLLAAIATLVGGTAEGLRVLVAFGICVGLTVCSFAIFLATRHRGSTWQLAAILGGTFARIGLAAGTALALFFLVPSVAGTLTFWLWLALAYWLTLGLEVTEVCRTLKTMIPSPAPKADIAINPQQVR